MDLIGNGPHESCEFSSDGSDDDIGVLASGSEAMESFAQPYLCLPGDVLDGSGQILLTQLNAAGDFGWVVVCPGGLDEDTTCMAVASFGNAAEVTRVAAGVLAGSESEVGH